MKLLVIVNPASGRELVQKSLPNSLAKLKHEGVLAHFDLFLSTESLSAYEICRREISLDYTAVLAVGGDGTSHEVANGILKSGLDLPLAVFACGTVNDLAYTLNLPRSLEEVEAMLRSYSIKRIDLGFVNGNYFLTVCAAGFIVDTAYRTKRRSKTIFGSLAYYFKAFIEFPIRLFRPYHFRVEYDDKVIEDKFYFFMVGNTQSIGGVRKIMAKAKTDDALIDVLLLRSSFFKIFPYLPLLYQMLKGKHLKHPSIEYFQTKKLKVTQLRGKPLPLDVDGEKFSQTPAEIEIRPLSLDILLAK